MNYYRLRDVKTPPFAYLLNQDEVIRSCHRCDMPLEQMGGGLRVEICALDSYGGYAEYRGMPMMADYWLIGDEAVRADLERLLPGGFQVVPIHAIMNTASKGQVPPPAPGGRQTAPASFYCFTPTRRIDLDPDLMRAFPPLWCAECHRHIPNIPIDFQPLPAAPSRDCSVASLRHLYLEGYDYLFHEAVAAQLQSLFPQMILEKLATEPINL